MFLVYQPVVYEYSTQMPILSELAVKYCSELRQWLNKKGMGGKKLCYVVSFYENNLFCFYFENKIDDFYSAPPPFTLIETGVTNKRVIVTAVVYRWDGGQVCQH